MQTGTKRDRQTDRQRDRQTDRQTGRQTDRNKDSAVRLIDVLVWILLRGSRDEALYGHDDGEIDIQIDRQIERQTGKDKQTYLHELVRILLRGSIDEALLVDEVVDRKSPHRRSQEAEDAIEDPIVIG